MKLYSLLLALSMVYPMARGAEATEAADSRSPQSSEPPGTSVVRLPGGRANRAVIPKKPVAEEAQPASVAQAPVESSIYFPKLIGNWKLNDARRVLGRPIHQRPSRDNDQTVDGQIYAFADPTNRYKEVELEFEPNGGPLRAVFMYPSKMTWQDCRRLWGMNVDSTIAGKGRTFYSYNNRHLDVLVDAGGKVISLGLY